MQILCLFTGIMSNVDVAWPIGLVSLAVQVLRYHFHNFDTDASFWCSRSFWLGVALLLSRGTNGLGRHCSVLPLQLARRRSIAVPVRQETMGRRDRCRCPVVVEAATRDSSAGLCQQCLDRHTGNFGGNESKSFWRFATTGFASWLVCSALENMSDFQKMCFAEAIRLEATASGTAVLGFAPYDGTKYWLWRVCRHPNYFFEYVCWNFLILLSIPSALDLIETIDTNHVTTNPWMVRALRAGIRILLMCFNRALYDCLLYWTGAEPAESRSVTRRPNYKDYHQTTSIFFPVSIPFLDHHRSPGWPIEKAE